MPTVFYTTDGEPKVEAPEADIAGITAVMLYLNVVLVGRRHWPVTVEGRRMSLHVAARILKLAPPGGITATEAVVAQARVANPGLAREFERLERIPPHLEAELGPLRVWVAPPRGTGPAEGS